MANEALQKINASKEKHNKLAQKLKNSNSLQGFKTSEMKEFFDRYKMQILDVLPKAIPADKFLQTAVNLVNSNPELQKCTPQSIIGFILNSAQLGLNIVPQLAECYAVPYNKKVGNQYEKQAQFQLGYKGLVKLVRNSGEIKNIWAEVVYKDDHFDYDLGLDPKLVHKRNDEVEQRSGDITHAYAIAEYRDGTKSFLVLNKSQIERLRAAGPGSGKNSPSWNAWYDEMAKVKAIKRLCKQLPLDTMKQEALLSDEQVIDAADMTSQGYNAFNAKYDDDNDEGDDNYTSFQEITSGDEKETEEIQEEESEPKKNGNGKSDTMFPNDKNSDVENYLD